ncbi:MAG: M23 family peptidase [Bacteroidetes bacterium]|nr:MAG: M23 family peptidase [Bacteroidota bacterium]
MINLNTRQHISDRKRGSHIKTELHKLKQLKKFALNKRKAFIRMDLRGKVLIYSTVFLMTGALIFSIFEYIDQKILRDDAFLLQGDTHIIAGSMLDYASSEFSGMGSGLPFLQPGVVVSTVSSFDYQVKEGDTLSEISKTYNINVGTLISYNKIEDVRRIWVGANLKIPDTDGLPYIVRKGDSLESIASDHRIPLNNILDANNLDSEVISAGDQLFIPGAKISEYDYKKATGTLFVYPTSGRLSSPFGYRSDPFTGVRRMHYGVDLANRIGTSVKATMSGTVIVLGDQPLGYGNYIVIRHERGFQSLYGHLSKILVRNGQRISQGQKIGEMGTSGRSTGSHLHFSLYKNNVPVDPLRGYLYR